jgi:V-type H+-transporting ATPase subunit C
VTSIRLFVESVLRYGLPPQFLAVLIKPNQRYESELRKVLSSTFNTAGGHHYDEEGILPFVHLDLDLET